MISSVYRSIALGACDMSGTVSKKNAKSDKSLAKWLEKPKPTRRPSDKFILAKKMRHNPSPPERIVWDIVSNKQFEGLKFRRQHILLGYIADFYCASLKLVLEIDGKQHNEPDRVQYDIRRDLAMRSRGYTVIRIPAREIFYNAKEALHKHLGVIRGGRKGASGPARANGGHGCERSDEPGNRSGLVQGTNR